MLLIGAEPFVNGVASALRQIEASSLGNVRLHAGDVRELMGLLPQASLDRIFLLFPDPWPKARHHKRRLVQDAFISDAARLLKPGGGLRFATDWADYADKALERFLASPFLHWTAQTCADWKTPPADHITTRYQDKRLGDCAPVWLEFLRV